MHLTECAALTLRPNSETKLLALAYCGTATDTDLKSIAAKLLADYKRPRAYIRLPALPRSANGKLDRRKLARAVKDLT